MVASDKCGKQHSWETASMYIEAVIEFSELKIAVLLVAYYIGEWAMKKFGMVCSILLVRS